MNLNIFFLFIDFFFAALTTVWQPNMLFYQQKFLLPLQNDLHSHFF